MKNKLLMLSGLPASGKSQFAKELTDKDISYIRISRDDLRHMRGKYWIPEQEGLITTLEHNCVHDALLAGYNVVVDATNLNPKCVKYWKSLASKLNVSFEEKFFDVPLEECISRDALRTEGKVGEAVIRRMYEQYLANRVELKPIKQDILRARAIICDLDGTLAIHDGRNPFDLNKCDTDLVNVPVKKIIEAYRGTVIFMSGREDYCREKTIKWIQDNVPLLRYPEPLLYMRTTGDVRSDYVVKYELFMNNVYNKYNVEYVLDDRDSVVGMWRKIGLTCLQCNYGDF